MKATAQIIIKNEHLFPQYEIDQKSIILWIKFPNIYISLFVALDNKC